MNLSINNILKLKQYLIISVNNNFSLYKALDFMAQNMIALGFFETCLSITGVIITS